MMKDHCFSLIGGMQIYEYIQSLWRDYDFINCLFQENDPENLSLHICRILLYARVFFKSSISVSVRKIYIHV